MKNTAKTNWSDFGPLPGYERCIRFEISDSSNKLVGTICVHNTAVGPSLGGLRIKKYGSEAEMIADCARLARGMSYKNAAAELPIGGGKAVINTGSIKNNLLIEFAKIINIFDGLYITAPDMNSTPSMMDVISQATPHVTCLSESKGGLGDPSPWTAKGVFLSLRAAVPFAFLQDKPHGLRILIQGYGKVGSALAVMCRQAGMNVTIADNSKKRRDIARLGGFTAVFESLPTGQYDIFSPNATGGMLNPSMGDGLLRSWNTKLVVGGANNQLENEKRDAEFLQQRKILWVPDFVANAGGVAEACAEWEMRNRGLSQEEALAILDERVKNIGARLCEIICNSQMRKTTALAAAKELAERTVAKHGGKLV